MYFIKIKNISANNTYISVSFPYVIRELNICTLLEYNIHFTKAILRCSTIM